MFFTISKIIGYFLSPLIWSLILFLLYLIKKRKAFLISGIAILLIFGNSFLFRIAINWWEPPLNDFPVVSDTTSAVVLLGGYASYNEESNRIRFFQSSDRLMQTLLFMQKNNLKTLVLSGGSSNLLNKERPEASIVREFLYELRMYHIHLLVDSVSRNTHESAIETRQLFNTLGLNSNIYLVTSAWHMKRAAGCFKKEKFIVTPIHADPLRSIEKMSFNEFIVPSIGTLSEWSILIKEWIGNIVYKIQGYI